VAPDIPHPVVALTGEQGSAKSTAMRLLAWLLDPATPQVRQPPRDLETWTVAAAGSYVVGLDNLSSLPDWLSDAICRAVTGDGLVKRALYTDDSLAVLAFRRCVLVNGIAFAQLRGDLVDRLLPVECALISEDRRRDEAELLGFFQTAWPAMLGGLLDLATRVLAVLPEVHLERRPRMADFARLVAATDHVLGTDALTAYLEVRRRTATELLEGDLLAAAVKRLALERGSWEGTAGELLAALTPEPPPKGWPATPQGMAARLKRAAPALRLTGVHVAHLGPRGHGGSRTWTLAAEKTRNELSPTSPTSAAEQLPWAEAGSGADIHGDVPQAGRAERHPNVTADGPQTRRPERYGDDGDIGELSMRHLSGDAS
jgi:hypothetical protein